MKRSLLLLVLVAAVPRASAAPAKKAAAPRAMDAEAPARIVGAVLTSSRAYDTVASLTDTVGGRLAGTPESDRAIEWGLAAMKAAGLDKVHKEPVTVEKWVRGELDLQLVAPGRLPLHGLAIGHSPPTPPDGIEGEVVVVESLAELEKLGSAVAGKIVLFNKALRRVRNFESYGDVVPQRSRGSAAAQKLGALAVLVRSVGTGNHGLAHTGSMWNGPFVPAAAIRAEDADLIVAHLRAKRTVRVRLRQTSHDDGTVPSANVVGEIPGSEKPDEIVLLGAHLDSWDVGRGAIDDGAGCAMILETARVLKALGLRPRRTIRVVLFTNEENGLSGARAYGEAHQAEVKQHVAAMEADSGAGRPYGAAITVPAALEKLAAIIAPLRALGVSETRITDEGGADLIPLHDVPAILVDQDITTYFDWHHTSADTLDKIDRSELDLATASFAAIAFTLADMVDTLPRPVKRLHE